MSLARLTATRAIALVAVGTALLATGCGDSSSSSKSSSTTDSAQAQAIAPQHLKSQGERGGDNQESQGAGGAKHAPKVKIPAEGREAPITPQRKAHSTIASIALESPSFVKPDGYHVALPASATCEGKNVPPTLRWKGVPAGTKELVLFTMNFVPVNGSIFFDWAVGGLDPELTEIKDGKLPAGAILGKNGFGRPGYSICPPKDKGETYVFYLFALFEPLGPKSGFDPTKLREEALAEHANSGFLAVTYHVY